MEGYSIQSAWVLPGQSQQTDTDSLWVGMLLMPIVVGLLLAYYYWQYRRNFPARQASVEKIRKILITYFVYYKTLTPEAKITFERRVIRFIREKKFIGRGFAKVPLAMKVLVAASAVQLTFGLPEIILQHFNRILIYPRQYFSVITRKYHKGEVNPRMGAIVLSWENFIEGYAQPHDSFNVGLHEMAHALKLENLIDNDERGFFSAKLLEQWQQQSTPVIQQIREGSQTFFREYAATDDEEFFAVAVENFFERPLAFHQQFPGLYNTLVLLLNQDPLKMNSLNAT